jgi:hypothetical protein
MEELAMIADRFRHPVLATLAASALALALSAGCGDDGSSSSGAGGGGGGSGDCAASLTPVANGEFCADTPAALDCGLVTGSHTSQLCGVALKQPPGELARSTDVEEFGGSGAPDLACFTPAGYPTANASESVTLRGFVRIFSNGCQSNDVDVEVYSVQPDGQLGAVLGSTTTASSCVDIGDPSDVEDCDERWECPYEIQGIPSETELVVRTSGTRWQPLVAYNLYIASDQIVDGVHEHHPRALATDDYGVIAQAAIGQPITAGHGAIAGEVHDCGDVRLTNAVAEVDVQKRALTYFTSDEDNPLPDLNAFGTSKLGLYAAIDVVPGPATVAAAGLVDGQVVALGEHRVYVYPDTVTSLTFRGVRPTQVP